MTSPAGAAPSGVSPEPIVSLRDVSKVYSGDILALDGFALDVARGEFLSVLGPSGCGKSTMLRIVAGLSRPTRGAVDGPAQRARGRKDRGIGFVFQEPTLLPWASVFENVRLPLRLAGESRAAATARVMDALESVGLADRATAFPRELSGGMRMRVSIARALVPRPQLLLMDEPFAALDEITRFRLNDDILSLKARFGWTVVFVTHSVFESVYLSDRVAVMAARPGRVVSRIDLSPPPERGEAFRTSASYGAACRTVSAALRDAMAASGAASGAAGDADV